VKIKKGFELKEFIDQVETVDVELPLRKCVECGKMFATSPQIEKLMKEEGIDIPEELMNLCPDCRNRAMARKFKEIAVNEISNVIYSGDYYG